MRGVSRHTGRPNYTLFFMRFADTRLLALTIGLTLCSPLLAKQVNGVMSVSALVETSCLIATTPDMNFGTYNTVQANNQKTAQTTVSVRCVQASPGVRLSLNEGQHPGPGSTCGSPKRRLKVDGKEQFLTYNMYSNSARTTVLGCQTGVNDHLYPSSAFTSSATQVTLVVYGKVEAGQDVEAGLYQDTMTVSLTF